MTKADTAAQGIVLLGKRQGLTSFASLGQVKTALGTRKVGHTGTLDSFADGLLVVLSGHLTHLVEHFSAMQKTYRAIVCFGRQTDTLELTGKVTSTGRAATEDEVLRAVEGFRGELSQTPPEYSAVHVAGKRASDLARKGESVQLKGRKVIVWENEVEDFRREGELSYAQLRIVCSKGTYIRALARDIAHSIGTCAHLVALRRTQVGPFRLQDAAGADSLDPFSIPLSIERALHNKTEPVGEASQGRAHASEQMIAQIRDSFMLFTHELATSCGFECATLKAQREAAFFTGKPLNAGFFKDAPSGNSERIAVFSSRGDFAGVAVQARGRLSYGFTIPPVKRALRVFSWESFLSSTFPADWRAKGVALTVGSFEALHAGHIELVKCVTAQGLVSGIITFSTSIKDLHECIFTLDQRLSLFERLGLDFAVVADFSEEFSRIEGESFIETLLSSCHMRFMAEGGDFRCGRGGRLDMEALATLASQKGFTLCKVSDVLYGGEKISSGRVRREIREGNFDAARQMLGRSFALDAKPLSWQATADGTLVCTMQSEVTQVLPKDGTYPVRVIRSDGSVACTQVRVEGGTLTLHIAGECTQGSAISSANAIGIAAIEAIEFDGAQ